MGEKKKSYLGYQPKGLNIQKLASYVNKVEANEANGSKPKATKLSKGKAKRF